MPEPWEEAGKAILESIEDRAKDFLEENTEAREFLAERAQRVAKLLWKIKVSGSDAERDQAKSSLTLAKAAIETELLAVAIRGQEAAKVTFMEIVKTAFGVVVKALPAFL